ncbi:MAG TPA: hypothetical protein DD473_15885 [Planctomycetaceae bacterium]|nr:hypothetical protein [Planctomycetaceae bacterium]
MLRCVRPLESEAVQIDQQLQNHQVTFGDNKTSIAPDAETDQTRSPTALRHEGASVRQKRLFARRTIG